jgi:Asp-tRNA(Asn)/Glu-tRNA(Gln) amidotransferase A subunit family amidase
MLTPSSTRRNSDSANGQNSIGVGKDTIAYCTSCRMDLNHVIAAMQGDLIKRVQCRTCKKEHGYKAPKGVQDPMKSPEAAKAKTPKAPTRKSIEVEWEEKMHEFKAKTAKVYGIKTKFEMNDKINHPTFGQGIVTKILHPNKVEVLFQMDLKVLIHAG